jgi:acrylyl-CoA reductase (NADPH)
MSAGTFRALLISEQGGEPKLADLAETALPEGNVTVAIEASTINYKDALILGGRMPLVRHFPMVPGIDLAGIVVASDSVRWRPGDRVIANGWGLGERHWGGFAERARLDGEWLLACPSGLSSTEAMAIGTAGYTAMLCVLALARHGVRPEDGEVLVTGATGGVGSVAIALLAGRGFRVAAATGRPEEEAYLRDLGAAELVDRAELASPGAPLQPERWAGAIDTAGSHILANICASLRYGGVVAATGIAQGADLPAAMYPFALRGVTICGIDSVMAPRERREEAWACLAAEIDRERLALITSRIGLAAVPARAADLLDGRTRGRVVVDMVELKGDG